MMQNVVSNIKALLNPPSSSTTPPRPRDGDLLAFIRPLLLTTESDPTSILDQLEQGLKDSGYHQLDTLPLPLAAALFVLDARTGRNTMSGWSIPPIGAIIAFSKRHYAFQSEPDTPVSAGLDSVQPAESIDNIDTPRLFASLSRHCDKGADEVLSTTWEQHKERLVNETTNLAKRDEIMARILSACLRCDRNYPTSNLGGTIRAIITTSPKPMPTPILNVLLAHRANSDEFTTRRDAEGIDRTDNDQSSAADQPNGPLRQTWTKAKSQGAQVDVRSYMIYMEGLGKLADIEGLQRAWSELLADEHCRQMHQGSYPPVIAFNHMLSCALLVPKTGPPVALELFERAIQSRAEINIITINTILRHHARMADINGMNSLFALAATLNLQPDVVTYTTLVQGLLRAENVDMAKNILSRMLAQGLEPNERMCSLLVADLARSGSQAGLQRAEEMMSEMRRKGMNVTEVTWTSLISGYFRGGWEQDAWAAVDRMKRGGWRLNRVGYNMILKQGQGTWSIKVLEQMISEGVRPNSDTFAIVLMPLVTSKQWNEADRVIEIMRQFGFRAEKGALAKLVKRAELRRSR